MLPYIDQLITRYVLLGEIAAYDELNRLVPTKYHLAHFKEQKELYLPFLAKIIQSNTYFEDVNRAKLLIKKNLLRNFLILKTIKDIFDQLDNLFAKPISTNNINIYYSKFSNLHQVVFSPICFLVDKNKIDSVTQCLTKLGWKLDKDNKKFKYCEVIKFKSNLKIDINIRTKILGKDLEYFLENSEQIQIADLQLRTLNRTHAFLLNCLYKANSSWIYDAFFLAKNLDWKILTNTAKDLDKTYTLLKTLDYLKKEFNLHVPNSALEELKGKKLSFAQKLEKKALNSPPFGFREQLLRILADFSRQKNLSISELPAFINANAD